MNFKTKIIFEEFNVYIELINNKYSHLPDEQIYSKMLKVNLFPNFYKTL